jgi:hypothetical protein
VIGPFPAGRQLHVPAISAQIQGAIEQRTHPVVIDLGGDAQGSRVLAPYARQVRTRTHTMCFVVNPYRPFMSTVNEIKRAVQEIEAGARLLVTELVSNPNLMSQSSPELFWRGHHVVKQASQELGLPIAFAVASVVLAEKLDPDHLDVELVVLHRYFPMFDVAESRNEGDGEGLS